MIGYIHCETALKDDEGDSPVSAAPIAILLQRGKALDERPRGLVGDAELFPGDEIADGSSALVAVENLPNLYAQLPAGPARSVSMNQL